MPPIEGSFAVTVNSRVKVRELKNRLADAAEHALVQVARRLLADSKAFVPVLTGALKDSGKVEIFPTLKQAVSMVRVVYDLEYAERQHEIPYNHPSLGFFGAARYLTKPLEMFGDFYQRLFTFEMQRYIDLKGDL